jgi:hypothetical protein
VVRKPEVTHDVGSQVTGSVQRGRLETRSGAAARQLSARRIAALEDEHLLPGLGEIGGGHEAVVAGADDEDVRVRHRRPPTASP